jgi:hypothetical protein
MDLFFRRLDVLMERFAHQLSGNVATSTAIVTELKADLRCEIAETLGNLNKG